jgi:hypothetical protein
MAVRFTDHAREECERRVIPLEVAQAVVERPQQVVPNVEGRQAYQSKIAFGEKIYLVRAIVEETGDGEQVVITVYRTSKIEKYWRTGDEGNV